MLETDGSSRAQGGGVGIIPRTHNGPAIAQTIKLAFIVSNNEVEYEAVILGLRVAKSLSITIIELRYDSQLVTSKLRGEYEAKTKMMEQYRRIVKPFLAKFKRVQVTQVPSSENQMANARANLETNALYLCNVSWSVMDQSSILGTIFTTKDQ